MEEQGLATQPREFMKLIRLLKWHWAGHTQHEEQTAVAIMEMPKNRQSPLKSIEESIRLIEVICLFKYL